MGGLRRTRMTVRFEHGCGGRNHESGTDMRAAMFYRRNDLRFRAMPEQEIGPDHVWLAFRPTAELTL
jgi:hypothetical protein